MCWKLLYHIKGVLQHCYHTCYKLFEGLLNEHTLNNLLYNYVLHQLPFPTCPCFETANLKSNISLNSGLKASMGPAFFKDNFRLSFITMKYEQSLSVMNQEFRNNRTFNPHSVQTNLSHTDLNPLIPTQCNT